MSGHQFSLDGRKALVTGASRGIGRAIAEGLAGAGADVAIAARNIAALEGCAKAIGNLGRRAHLVHMDVSDVASCRRGVAEAAEKLGGVDILVNNAGVEQACSVLTNRPGRIKTVVPVDLPRPRHYDMVASPEFQRLQRTVLDAIRSESLVAASLQETLA